MNSIKLSLIIPVYGVENYIGGLLESLLPQLNDQVECIFVNDGTKDKSFEILKKYLAKYPNNNYQLLEQENQGLSMARNNGMKLVKGDYFGFIDSDDEVEPNYIKEILNVINHNEFDIMFFNATYLQKDNSKYYINFPLDEGITLKNDEYLSNILKTFYNAAWLRIFNKKFLFILDFDKGKTMEDLLAIPICYPYAEIFYHLPKNLYKYFYRETSIMNHENYLNKNLDSFLYGANKYKTYKEHPYLSSTYQKFILNGMDTIINSIDKIEFSYFLKLINQYEEHFKYIVSTCHLSKKQTFLIQNPVNFYQSYESNKTISYHTYI